MLFIRNFLVHFLLLVGIFRTAFLLDCQYFAILRQILQKIKETYTCSSFVETPRKLIIAELFKGNLLFVRCKRRQMLNEVL